MPGIPGIPAMLPESEPPPELPADVAAFPSPTGADRPHAAMIANASSGSQRARRVVFLIM
jgi:hypothetical protein